MKVPGNELATERKGQGAKVPGSKLARVLLADSLQGANWPRSRKAVNQETCAHLSCGPEILGQTHPDGVKTLIFSRYLSIAPQPYI